MKIRHVLLDPMRASGVNFFCTTLNRALCAAGLDSALAITPGAVEPGSIARRLDAEWPDVVHVHGIWLRGHHEAAVWARRNGVPVVWSTHGMTAPWSLRHKWWKKGPAWWLYQKSDLKRAALVHVTSEQEAKWNLDLGLANRQILVPLGTEEKVLSNHPRNGGLPSSWFTILFVGRIYPVKGLVNLIQAMGVLKKRNNCQSQNFPFRLRIVGPDQDGYQAVLQTACDHLDLTWDVAADGEMSQPHSADVIFTGPKFSDELSSEYANCDVLVLPSFTENFGGVVVDALAHGKPVIASRFTPWRDLERRGCGWWVDNSPESLANAIREASVSPSEKRDEMGMRGRAYVQESFTWMAVAKKMVEGYQTIVACDGIGDKAKPKGS